MTIASAFNEIAVAQGGTADKTGTITGAVDALNDALAGSDQAQGRTIEDAVRLLGQHIGGGSSVTVESLTATENKTYTAPSGKAYSPVTVNVSGGGTSTHDIICYYVDSVTFEIAEISGRVYSTYLDNENYEYVPTETLVTSANAGDVLHAHLYTEQGYEVSLVPLAYGTFNDDAPMKCVMIGNPEPDSGKAIVMPDADCAVLYTLLSE